jgi:hypothetical protein
MRTLRALAVGLLTTLALSTCGELGGPEGAGTTSLMIRVTASPAFSSAAGVAITNVRVMISRVDTVQHDTVSLVDRVVPFNVNQNTLNFGAQVTLARASEDLRVQIDFRDAQGATLFTSVQTVRVVSGGSSSPQLPAPTYIGPGSTTAFITISPRTTSVVAGDTASFAISATDGQQLPVPSVYVSWSTDAVGGSVNALGTLTAPAAPGTIHVIARTPSTLTAPNGVTDTATVTVLAAGAGSLAGRVVDGNSQTGLAGVTVDVLDAGTGGLVTSVTTASDGSYTTGALVPAVYQIQVTLSGYVTTTLFDATLSGSGTTTLPVIPLAPDTRTPGSLSGTVKDATNNAQIPNATVELRGGVNATTGTPLATITTDGAGAFNFSQLAPGTYTLVGGSSGYVNGSRTSVVLGSQTIAGQDLFLSPAGSSDIRMVLTWGAVPSDLDSHLTGPDSTGGRFHVYYASQGSLTSDPYAALDVDQTNSFGPETITITRQATGVYRYSVHDFTNEGVVPSSALAASGARVDLYISGTLVRQFNVPNLPGTLWTVFELNGSTITPVNAMSYQSNSDSVSIRMLGGPYRPGNDAALIEAAAAASPKH